MSYFVTFKDIPQILSYNGSVVMRVLFLFVFLFIVFFSVNKKNFDNKIYNLLCSCFMALLFSSILAFGMIYSTMNNGYYYENNIVHIVYGKNDYKFSKMDVKSVEIVKPKSISSGWSKANDNADSKVVDTILRVNGNSTGNVKVGIFKLNTGERAKVFLYLPCESALLIHTKDGEVYYIGSPNIMDLYKSLVSD